MGLRVLIVCLGFWAFMPACKTTGGAGDQILYYRVKVQRGESLAQIAARFDTTWKEIAKDNNLHSPADVRVGMTLNVRPGPGGYLAGSENMNREKTGEATSSKRRGFFSRLFGGEDENHKAERPRGLLFDGGAATTLTWPIKGKITSNYGMRGRRMHEGIDIDGDTGDKIVAAGKGIVKVASRTSGYGKTVIISHGDYSTLYAHLSAISVSVGDVVARGDVIGEVGESGHATGPHLHFEVRNSANKAVNPLPFLQEHSSRYSAR